MPWDIYRRRLAILDGDGAPVVARRLKTWNAVKTIGTGLAPSLGATHDDDVSFFVEAAKRPFVGDIARGNICAFIAGNADTVDQLEVTVTSILQFVPGMRVAVAVEAESLETYRRWVHPLVNQVDVSAARRIFFSFYRM